MRFSRARVRSVIEVGVVEGKGTMDDPARQVVYYIDPDTGTELAQRDRWAEEEREKEAQA